MKEHDKVVWIMLVILLVIFALALYGCYTGGWDAPS